METTENRSAVLVVEGDQKALGILVSVLDEGGYEVMGASDGDEALFLLTQSDFRAVVLELVLPGTSGIEVLSVLRRDHPQISVVVLTSITDRNTRDIVMGGGVSAYLTKPCGADALLDAVKEAVAGTMASGPAQEKTAPSPAAGGSLVKPGVLVVDDEDVVRNNVCRALTQEGYKAVGAKTGEEALEKITRGNYQVVILDIRLPGMDGLEVLGAISDRVPDIMPIMLSGLADYESVQAAMAGRAYDYLTKPCSLKDLLTAVKNALEHVGRRDEYTVEINYSRGKTILVVDDDKHVRENVVRFLSREGYDAVGASDGEEALFVLSQEQFAIVVLDVKMPGMSGAEVLRRIKSGYPGTHVIMLTGLDPAVNDDARILNQAIEDGAYQCLQKPCKLDELVKSIEMAFKEENTYWGGFSPLVKQVDRLSEEDAWIG